MPLFLKNRQPNLVELMDREDCDPVLLENTYRQFATINLLLSQWKRIYKKHLMPLMTEDKTYTLLDLGFGGGDIPLKLAQWTKKDGIHLQITAIETDRRAYGFARSLSSPETVTFRNCSSADLVKEQATFDFVISNHLLHHLKKKEMEQILLEAKALSKTKILFNDIERSGIGYFLFNTFSRLIFSRSFITPDGLTSIKRSYNAKELKQQIPGDWQVKKIFPFRLLLIHNEGS